jgi:hypothetical protein
MLPLIYTAVPQPEQGFKFDLKKFKLRFFLEKRSTVNLQDDASQEIMF